MTALPHDPNDQLPRLLNIAAVAKVLGVDIRHVRRLVHERRIPVVKWGHLLRFDPDEIRGWLDAHRRPEARPSDHRWLPRRPSSE